MKRITTRISYVLLLAAAVFVSSCSKDGDTGPQGEQGPPGPAGPAGPGGPQGEPGTANVIYSAWLDVEFDAVTNEAGDTVFAYTKVLDIPALTAEILNSGEVKLYFNWGTAADPVVDPLPIYDAFFGYTITTTFAVGQVEMWASFDPSPTTNDAGAPIFKFRYILIPGGQTARSSKAVNWGNYKEVQAYLGLKD